MDAVKASLAKIVPIEVQLADLALVLDPSGVAFAPDESTLLVADLHFEKASSFARRGLYLPPYDTVDTLQELAKAAARYRPVKIVCMGDSFHDASGHERLSSKALDAIKALTPDCELIWISGNHDPEAKHNLPGSNCKELELRGVVLRHEPQFKPGLFEIAGHLHPCARIEQRGRSLRRPCFAVNYEHMVLPAFGALTGSLNVLDKAYHNMMGAGGAMAVMLGQTEAFAIGSKRLLPD